MTVVMSFAEAPAAAAGTEGDGNAGEMTKLPVCQVFRQSLKLQSGLVIRHSLNLNKSLRVNKWPDLLMNVSFSSKITTSQVVVELTFC